MLDYFLMTSTFSLLNLQIKFPPLENMPYVLLFSSFSYYPSLCGHSSCEEFVTPLQKQNPSLHRPSYTKRRHKPCELSQPPITLISVRHPSTSIKEENNGQQSTFWVLMNIHGIKLLYFDICH